MFDQCTQDIHTANIGGFLEYVEDSKEIGH